MGNDFDIFSPPKTKVIKGVEGKLMLVHSNSVKCGKTTVGSEMPKPLYLRLEQGANAIDGMDYIPLDSWADLKKVTKQLTSKKTKSMMIDGKKQEVLPTDLYTTIIFDTFDVAIRWCSKYVCIQYGVNRLRDGNDGYGLWQEYADEWFNTINPLLNAGYFIYGISHSEIKKVKDGRTGEETEKYAPKGDKRSIDLVIEAVDFLGYVKSNGVDENGDVIKSSIYFAETDEYLAGSRFTYMPTEIKEFTAENIQNAIKHAVEMKEKETGHKSITFEEKKLIEEKKEWEYDEIIAEIGKYTKRLYIPIKEDMKDKEQIEAQNKNAEITDIVEAHLEVGAKIKDATKKQIPQLEMILFDLQELAEEREIEID